MWEKPTIEQLLGVTEAEKTYTFATEGVYNDGPFKDDTFGPSSPPA